MDKLPFTADVQDMHEVVDFIILNSINVRALIAVQAVRQLMLGLDWREYLREEQRKKNEAEKAA